MSNNLNSDSKNEKLFDSNIETSNHFTFKGEEDEIIQFESLQLSSPKIDLDKNRKNNYRSNSQDSIKILNLTDFSFCDTEHKLKFFESDINGNNASEAKKTLIDTFSKIKIIPFDKKIKLQKFK